LSCDDLADSEIRFDRPFLGLNEGALKSGNIHIVFADLTLPAGLLTRLYATLSADERQHAARFHFDQHRSRFIAGRGLLRSILGAYMGLAPEILQFIYGPNGKPHLQGNPLQFNVSHSEDYALYALALDVPLGVDLERLRWSYDLDGIARTIFSSAERAEYRALSRDRRTEAFFRCWTRKEAFIKAIGDGLSYSLDRFDVSLGKHAHLLSLDGDHERADQWSLYHLSPGEGYVGALAIQTRNFEVYGFRLDGERAWYSSRLGR
jgi:4'-phosphopantetheinyl transferase